MIQQRDTIHAATAERYDASFFQAMTCEATYAVRATVPLIMDALRPASVLDVGCGTGAWLSVFAALGVADILGVDGPWVPAAQLLIPEDRFQRVELEKPLAFGRKFDLVLCLEVAEHLPARAADVLVESLVRHGDVVVFSAAVPFQGGTHHVNEQWPSYWVEKFGNRGFVGVDYLRRRLWERLVQHETWYYAQNMLIFVRQDVLEQYSVLLQEYRYQGGPPVSLVHPKLFAKYVPPESHITLRQVLRRFPAIVGRSLRYRVRQIFQRNAR